MEARDVVHTACGLFVFVCYLTLALVVLLPR
jgi:hypothetical protein